MVQAGQPEFLALVAIGCLMLASAVSLISYLIYREKISSILKWRSHILCVSFNQILPLSIQGEYRYERDAITLEEDDALNQDIHRVVSALFHNICAHSSFL